MSPGAGRRGRRVRPDRPKVALRNGSQRGASVAVPVLLVLAMGFLSANADPFPPDPPFDPRPLMRGVQQSYNGGTLSFSVIGEAKNGCSANPIFDYIDQNRPSDFSATMGDMVRYPPAWENFEPLAECAGWFMRSHPTWPAIGDQEQQPNYYNFYGLPTDSFAFDMGPARFVFLSYFDPPNVDGGLSGKYPTEETPVLNYDTNITRTLRDTLEQATAQDKHIFVFSHVQYYSSGSGTKYYCCSPPSSIVNMYAANNVRIVFQADNPGYSTSLRNGVYYIRSSGARLNPKFYSHVEIDGATVSHTALEVDGSVMDTLTINGTTPDGTPPATPGGLSAAISGVDQIQLDWSSSSDPDSGISRYNIYRDGLLIAHSEATSFIDAGLIEATTYTYAVSAENHAGLKSTNSASVAATTGADVTPPTLVLVSARGIDTQVTLVFSEPLEQISAESSSNYILDGGISVSSATLGSDLLTVTLSTSPLSEGVNYTLGVSNVRDRASTPNSIAAGTTENFDFQALFDVLVSISDGGDDVEEESTGTVDARSGDLELVVDGSDTQTVGLRFLGVGVPQGAVVTNASVQFTVDEVDTAAAALVIEGEAADDAASFGQVSPRSRTSASVAWAPPAWGTVGEAGPDQRTPNLAAVVQEIVNRPGWSSGSALALIFTGSGTRTAESFDGNSFAAPTLHIEYRISVPDDPPTPPTGLSVQ